MASADRPDRGYVDQPRQWQSLEISERTGELVEVDAAGRNYTHAATIPEFHPDVFDDTDQDGHPDIEEEFSAATRPPGTTTPWRDSFNIDTDGDGVNDAQDVDPNDPASTRQRPPMVPRPVRSPRGSDACVRARPERGVGADARVGPGRLPGDPGAVVEVEQPSLADSRISSGSPATRNPLRGTRYEAPSDDGGVAGAEWSDG